MKQEEEAELKLEVPQPLPGVCLHVGVNGRDGYPVDGQVRVCGIECASDWAKLRQRIVAGESSVRNKRGRVISIEFWTKTPDEFERPLTRFSGTETKK